jgi:predicted dehydrogenase
MNVVRLGFIGTGGMAGAHMRQLKTFDDVEFAAMCDISEDRAKQRANEFGGKVYTDFQKMYDKEELDAVYICTPPFAHGAQERIACEKGVAMFIEKPIAAELEQAIIINDHVQRSGVITSVGYHWRYGGNAQYAKSTLEKEPQILGALGYWMGGMPGAPWWRVRAQSGGQHVEQTTHIFDLARYILGDAKLVHGVATRGGMTDIPNYDIDDLSMVNIQFESGAIANIVSCCAMEKWGRVHLEVFCRGLVVTIGGPNKINRKGEETPLPNEGGQDRDRVFIDAVKTGDTSKILSPYSDALKTLRIMMAASKSFETGKAIDL